MARTTLLEALAGLALQWRLNTRVRRRRFNGRGATTTTPQQRNRPMNLSLFDGYKTYIIAVAMLVAAIAQLLGMDLPTFEGHAAGQLLMEALAILFLRKGIKSSA